MLDSLDNMTDKIVNMIKIDIYNYDMLLMLYRFTLQLINPLCNISCYYIILIFYST